MKTYVRKKPDYTEIENVDRLCRLCLDKAEEGVAIFGDEQDVCAAVAMRIMSCVGLEMQQDDLLPNQICKACHEKLEKYYKFRKKCEISYQKLKYHLMAVKFNKYRNVNKVSTIETLPVQNVDKRDVPMVLEEQMGVKRIEEEQRQIDVQIIKEEQRRTDVQIIYEEEKDDEKKLVIQTDESDMVDYVGEKVVQMEEVRLPLESESPDIATFISGVLVELGVLAQQGSGLALQQDIHTFQLETGTGEQLVLELVEEDDEVAEIKPEPPSLLVKRLTESKTKTKQDKTSDRPWCSVCGRAFSSRSARARHARLHGGARPHQCHRCGATFAHKSVLQRHMLVHLEVRPHRCSQCPKSFTQRGALEAHARTHAAARDRHMRLHACTLCDKVFLYASGLSRHMFQHTGRAYACPTCDKRFNDKSSLLRHRRNICHGLGIGAGVRGIAKKPTETFADIRNVGNKGDSHIGTDKSANVYVPNKGTRNIGRKATEKNNVIEDSIATRSGRYSGKRNSADVPGEVGKVTNVGKTVFDNIAGVAVTDDISVSDVVNEDIVEVTNKSANKSDSTNKKINSNVRSKATDKSLGDVNQVPTTIGKVISNTVGAVGDKVVINIGTVADNISGTVFREDATTFIH